MRLMQGSFSALPDLTDDEVRSQIATMLARGWSLAVEFTDDPHPRNVYWEMWGLPMFDATDPDDCLDAIRRCVETFPDHYVRLSGFDRSHGRQTIGLSFIVHRPAEEPRFRLERGEGAGRRAHYRITL